MTTELYPPKSGSWRHWQCFSKYCFDKVGRNQDGVYENRVYFRITGDVLSEFNGKIIWPNKDPDSTWSLDHLEFETEEDLVIFKLKFN